MSKQLLKTCIVDCPIKKGGFHSYVKLPEGNMHLEMNATGNMTIGITWIYGCTIKINQLIMLILHDKIYYVAINYSFVFPKQSWMLNDIHGIHSIWNTTLNWIIVPLCIKRKGSFCKLEPLSMVDLDMLDESWSFCRGINSLLGWWSSRTCRVSIHLYPESGHTKIVLVGAAKGSRWKLPRMIQLRFNPTSNWQVHQMVPRCSKTGFIRMACWAGATRSNPMVTGCGLEGTH